MQERIGQYQIIARLGADDRGVLYKALHPQLDRLAYIRLLPREFTDNHEMKRILLRELKVAESVWHPSVNPILDTVELDNGQLAVVTSYYEGKPLSEKLLEGEVRFEALAALVDGLLGGLAAAHSQGVVHGFLDPNRIIVDSNGSVLITDLGFASLNRWAAQGAMVSTSALPVEPEGFYVAPEQIAGHSTSIESDVFSAGIVILEAATGQYPFDAENRAAMVFKILNADFAPVNIDVTDSPPGFTQALAGVLGQMLEKQAHDRISAFEAHNRLSNPDKQTDYKGLPKGAVEVRAKRINLTRSAPKWRDEDPLLLGRTPSGRISVRGHDPVWFAVSTPARVVQGQAFVLDVWAFLSRQRSEAMKRAKEEADEAIRTKSRGPTTVERGVDLTIRVSIPGFDVDERENVLEWVGKIANVTFKVSVPPELRAGSHAGWAKVFLRGLEIARLDFCVNVSFESATRADFSVAANGHRTAFASYASKDRREVLARVQGISKTGVDVYVDVARLRSGDKYNEVLLEMLSSRDVFYLFWSRAASKSTWVEKEWRCALETRGINYIDPVPLVSPDIVPPPKELAGVLHFNDWMLAYMQNAAFGIGRKRWWAPRWRSNDG